MEGWIPVTERLPEHEDEVIVTAKYESRDGTFVAIDWFDFSDNNWFNNPNNVTAWMEMPEAYKGEES